jgi:hypothetical protein
VAAVHFVEVVTIHHHRTGRPQAKGRAGRWWVG